VRPLPSKSPTPSYLSKAEPVIEGQSIIQYLKIRVDEAQLEDILKLHYSNMYGTEVNKIEVSIDPVGFCEVRLPHKIGKAPSPPGTYDNHMELGPDGNVITKRPLAERVKLPSEKDREHG
jgi:hypothetical protein